MKTVLKSGTPVEISWNMDSSSYDVYIDTFLQSNLDLNRPSNLNLPYAKRLSVIIEGVFPEKTPLSVLHLGAGALSLVRYLEAVYPESKQTAVEIEQDLIDYVHSVLSIEKSKNIEFIFDDAIKAAKEMAIDESKKFDIIVSDFRLGDFLLDRSSSIQYYTSIHDLLHDGGIALINAVEDQPLEIEFSYTQYRNLEKVFDKSYLFADEEHILNNKPTNVIIVGRKGIKPVDTLGFIDRFETKNLVFNKESIDVWKDKIPNIKNSRELKDLGLIAKLDNTNYINSKEDIWNIVVGGYVQSSLNMTSPGNLNLETPYIISKAVDGLVSSPNISVLHLGGGGMSLLRQIKSINPTSSHTVVEISRDLVDYIKEMFPLVDDTGIEILHSDARVEVDALLKKSKKFDLIVSDVKLRNFPPAGLYNEEFYSKIVNLLKPDGVLVVDLVDTWQPKKDGTPSHEICFNIQQISKNFKFFSVAADLPALKTDCESPVLLFASNQRDLEDASGPSSPVGRVKIVDKSTVQSWILVSHATN